MSGRKGEDEMGRKAVIASETVSDSHPIGQRYNGGLWQEKRHSVGLFAFDLSFCRSFASKGDVVIAGVEGVIEGLWQERRRRGKSCSFSLG